MTKAKWLLVCILLLSCVEQARSPERTSGSASTEACPVHAGMMLDFNASQRVKEFAKALEAVYEPNDLPRIKQAIAAYIDFQSLEAPLSGHHTIAINGRGCYLFDLSQPAALAAFTPTAQAVVTNAAGGPERLGEYLSHHRLRLKVAVDEASGGLMATVNWSGASIAPAAPVAMTPGPIVTVPSAQMAAAPNATSAAGAAPAAPSVTPTASAVAAAPAAAAPAGSVPQPVSEMQPSAVASALNFTGTSSCGGMTISVSFSYDPQSSAVSEFKAFHACKQPEKPGGGVSWATRSSGHVSKGGTFKFEDDGTLVAGQVRGRNASGTISEQFAIGCKGGRFEKSCTSWIAKAE